MPAWRNLIWRGGYCCYCKGCKCRELLMLRTSERSRRSTEHTSEMTCQMALVGEACGVRNLRQREVRLSQHFLGSFDALLREIVVRRDAGGLLDFPRKVIYRQPGDRGQ